MSTIDNTPMLPIKLNKVRLSYPSLFTPKVWDEGKPAKYEATFILDKEKHQKEIDAINHQIDLHLEQLKVSRNKTKADHICLKDGDLTDREEYQNSYTIKATSATRFPIVNKDGVTPVHEADEIFYAGCYVSAYIDLWVYTKPNVGIGCNLRAIQFVSEGDTFGVPKFNISGKFDPIEDEELF